MVKPKIRPYFKAVFVSIFMAIIILFLLINYIASALKIEGSSMNPVLRDQERVIILKSPVNKNHIHRFDIIVFSTSREPHKKLIKRVIGLPGEHIEIKQGKVYVNNKILNQTFLSPADSTAYAMISMKPVKIPENHYFVIGDNRRISKDSRTFGLIPRDRIIGKAILRYWPFSRFGKIS
ncbi:MAG: signal peptidase I [Candidatus Aminicenantes bacterium]|nr:signal peptidase I [Candidatus Aminicenantes bacterium]